MHFCSSFLHPYIRAERDHVRGRSELTVGSWIIWVSAAFSMDIFQGWTWRISLIKKKKIIYLFLSVLNLPCCLGFSLAVASAGFSLQWLLLLWSEALGCTGFSSCGSCALERRFSSCGTRAELLRGMWNLPGPWIEPVSLVLAGRCLITGPPGKPRISLIIMRSHRTVKFSSSTSPNIF